MLRNVFVVVIASMLSLAILAACDAEEDDGVTILEDEPVTPLDDQTAADDEATDEQDDEDDQAGAAQQDEEQDERDSPGTGQSPDEEGPEEVSENIDVTLVDYEIEMATDTAATGNVGFVLTNEGEYQHGISIEPADSDGDETQIIGTMFVEPGEDEQLQLELEPGEYTIFCPVDDHREAEGMETSITVE